MGLGLAEWVALSALAVLLLGAIGGLSALFTARRRGADVRYRVAAALGLVLDEDRAQGRWRGRLVEVRWGRRHRRGELTLAGAGYLHAAPVGLVASSPRDEWSGEQIQPGTFARNRAGHARFTTRMPSARHS